MAFYIFIRKLKRCVIISIRIRSFRSAPLLSNVCSNVLFFVFIESNVENVRNVNRTFEYITANFKHEKHKLTFTLRIEKELNRKFNADFSWLTILQ